MIFQLDTLYTIAGIEKKKMKMCCKRMVMDFLRCVVKRMRHVHFSSERNMGSERIGMPDV